MVLLYVVAILVYIYIFYWYRSRREAKEIDGLKYKAVFITGCDTGFAHRAALELCKKGMHVFAGCYTTTGMENIEKKAYGLDGKMTSIELDVTSDESVEKAKNILEERTKPYGGLHAVINNAGIANGIFFDDFLTVEDYVPNMEVNCFGIVRVVRKTVRLIKQVKGRIINITSIAGRCPFTGLGPYTVSKHAANAYTDVLRKELSRFGVKVITIEPGFFKTPITNKTRIMGEIDKVNKRADEEVRREYGDEFIEKAMDHNTSMIDNVGAVDITPVVTAFVNAVISENPRKRYKIGWDCLLLWNPVALSPTNVQDGIFYFLDWAYGAPIPAVLQQK